VAKRPSKKPGKADDAGQSPANLPAAAPIAMAPDANLFDPEVDVFEVGELS